MLEKKFKVKIHPFFLLEKTMTITSTQSILFCKEKQTPSDPYQTLFESEKTRVFFISVLQTQLCQSSQIESLLCQREAYSGMIVTSKRALEALCNLLFIKNLIFI